MITFGFSLKNKKSPPIHLFCKFEFDTRDWLIFFWSPFFVRIGSCSFKAWPQEFYSYTSRSSSNTICYWRRRGFWPAHPVWWWYSIVGNKTKILSQWVLKLPLLINENLSNVLKRKQYGGGKPTYYIWTFYPSCIQAWRTKLYVVFWVWKQYGHYSP